MTEVQRLCILEGIWVVFGVHDRRLLDLEGKERRWLKHTRGQKGPLWRSRCTLTDTATHGVQHGTNNARILPKRAPVPEESNPQPERKTAVSFSERSGAESNTHFQIRRHAAAPSWAHTPVQ